MIQGIPQSIYTQATFFLGLAGMYVFVRLQYLRHKDQESYHNKEWIFNKIKKEDIS